MIEAEGCQYLGCEDVVTGRQLVHDIDAAAEVALCHGHETFVAASAGDPVRRQVLVEDGAGRLRVKVLLPPRPARALQVTATPIESDEPGRHTDRDVERWIRRLLESKVGASVAAR